MNTSVLYQTPTAIIVALLFILMLVFNRMGFVIHRKQIQKNPESASEGLGPIEGSLLGLLALLLSFAFGMLASRFDARKQTIVQEANDIGTAVLRADLYPDSIRNVLRADFKDYVDARIAYYNSGADAVANAIALTNSTKYSDKIWATVVQQAQDKENTLRSQQMIPAVNNMIDSVSTVEAARNATVPDSIFWFLFLLIITASLIVGYSSNSKKINHVIVSGFALMTVLTVFLIMDLDRPRRGVINTEGARQNIIALQGMFKQ